MSFPVLEVAGSPYEMGLAHGKALARQIAEYAAERVQLSGQRAWTGRDASRTEVMALAAATPSSSSNSRGEYSRCRSTHAAASAITSVRGAGRRRRRFRRTVG